MKPLFAFTLICLLALPAAAWMEGSIPDTMQHLTEDVVAVIDGLWAPPEKSAPDQTEPDTPQPQEKTEENSQSEEQENDDD